MNAGDLPSEVGGTGSVADYDMAMAEGRELDLSDSLYGGPDRERAARPPGYYQFLAGLVRSRDYRRVVEIGTHYGGSTQALCKGVSASALDDACVVTIDVTRLNDEALRSVPFLRRVQGDSLRPEVVEEACAHFDGPIDLLYVDSFHQRSETLQNIAVFANRLRPKVVIIDDIHLNPSMRDLWSELESMDGVVAYDLSTLVRRGPAGFGIVEFEPSFQWPEVEGGRLAAWLLWRRTHTFLDRAVPEKVQELARPAVIRTNAWIRRRH